MAERDEGNGILKVCFGVYVDEEEIDFLEPEAMKILLEMCDSEDDTHLI
jgi:hypothetical protein